MRRETRSTPAGRDEQGCLSPEAIAYAPEVTFQGQFEAQTFAEGFVLELLGA